MRWLFDLIARLWEGWKKSEDIRIAEQVEALNSGHAAVDRIKDLAVTPNSELSKEVSGLKERGKNLGIFKAVLLAFVLAGSLQAQDVDARISAMSRPELESFTKEVVSLAQDQQIALDSAVKENQSLHARLNAIQAELGVINDSLNKLSPPKKPKKILVALEWILRIIPVAALAH